MLHPERAAQGMESWLQFGLVCCKPSTTLQDNKSSTRINLYILIIYTNRQTVKILVKSYTINKIGF